MVTLVPWSATVIGAVIFGPSSSLSVASAVAWSIRPMGTPSTVVLAGMVPFAMA